MPDRVGDHQDVLIEGRAEHLGDVHVPGLADDGDDGRTGIDKGLEADVALRVGILAACHAERGQLGVLPGNLADFLKVLEVLGIGKRIAPFDVIDAEVVEAARDEQLVLQREIDALALAAVAESRVVNLDACHGYGYRLLDYCNSQYYIIGRIVRLGLLGTSERRNHRSPAGAA